MRREYGVWRAVFGEWFVVEGFGFKDFSGIWGYGVVVLVLGLF